MSSPNPNPGSPRPRRSRLITALLSFILLACVAVIVMDQMGMFGNAPFGTPAQTTTEPLPNPAEPSNGTGDGYDNLK